MKKSVLFTGTAFIIFMTVILVFPEKCSAGAADGITLCGRVLIPSLFPFTVCVLILMRIGFGSIFLPVEKLTKRIFGLDRDCFAVLILSMTGGYPVGARLVSELFEQKKVSRQKAAVMICCCVNAGPAFTVIAVGEGILHSKVLGYMLLVSHLFSSLILAAICGLLYKDVQTDSLSESQKTETSFAEIFISSVGDAAASVFSVCVFVILFSVVRSYLSGSSDSLPIKILTSLLEVTNAVAAQKNVYIIAFLLGFAGLSVWCQVFSFTGKFKPSVLLFFAARVLHGLFSCGIIFVLIKIFKPVLPTFENGVTFTEKAVYSTSAVSISLLFMLVLLFLSIYGKKYSRNFFEDMI